MVVYKVDRLSRALADFARIVEIFDAAGVSFVSVTQAFNTTTSMGRLTLNVLLSFAQFEREIIGERIRDKIAASKAKGQVDGRRGADRLPRRGAQPPAGAGGGRPGAADLRPLPRTGLDAPAEGRARRFRHPHAGTAASERTKQRRRRLLPRQALQPARQPALYRPHPARGQVHPGQHPAIVDEALWQAVQERLAANRQTRSRRRTAERPSPLAGRLFDPEGRKMRPSHARKNGRRYRYYVSADLVEGSIATGASGWRIPAPDIEAAVGSAVALRFREPDFLSEVLHFSQSAPEASAMLVGRIAELANRLDAPASPAGREVMRMLINRVELSRSELRAEVSLKRLDDKTEASSGDACLVGFPPFIVVAPLRLRHRGPELRIVLQGAAAPRPKPDPLLLQTLIEARAWLADYLDSRQRTDRQRHRSARRRQCR